jgi:uncharacterized phage-associated protein
LTFLQNLINLETKSNFWVKPMIDYLSASQYFIVKAYEDGKEAEMTNMKTQKLLYYAQSLHLALYDEPLFDEEIQAWQYGPVCPPVYRCYSEFGDKPLPILDNYSFINIPNETKELLDEVWDYFGQYHAYLLSGMSHVEFPWKKARKGLPPDASSQEPISQEDMKELGYQKLDVIEKDNPAYKAVMTQVLKSSLASSPVLQLKKGEVCGWLNSLLD